MTESSKQFATGERSRVLMALDAMIESVQEDMRETDVGNHATLCALNGELKGLKAARTYIELDGLRPSNAIQMALPKPSAASETPRSKLADLLEVSANDAQKLGISCVLIKRHDLLEVIAALRCAPSAIGQKWRDPKDKPPHLSNEYHSQDVLLCMKARGWVDDHPIKIGHVSCGHWRPAGSNGNFDDDVLGWMPLPEVPSE